MSTSSARWLFAASATALMCALQYAFGLMAATVGEIADYYATVPVLGSASSGYTVNLVTYSYYIVYAVFGPWMPWLVERMPRGVLLLISTAFGLAGLCVQCAWAQGFEWLLAGSFVAAAAQPAIASSVSVIVAEYAPESHESRWLSLYVTLVSLSVGLGYLAGAFYGIDGNFTLDLFRLLWPAALLALVALLAAAAYFLLPSTRFEAELPITDHMLRELPLGFRRPTPSPLQRADEAVTETQRRNGGTIIGAATMWMMLVAYVLQNAMGNAFGLLLGQIGEAQGLTQGDLTTVIIAVAAITATTPFLVGLIMDKWQPWLLAPLLAITVQAVTQIGTFYLLGSNRTLGAMLWMIAMSVPNVTMDNVFLPALVRLKAAPYAPTSAVRATVNTAMVWGSTLVTALSSLVLLPADSDAMLLDNLGRMFFLVGVAATTIAATAAIMATAAAATATTTITTTTASQDGTTVPEVNVSPAGTTPAGTTPAGTTPAGTTPAGTMPSTIALPTLA